MSNQKNSSYNNYSTTESEFDKFDFFQDNNRLRNADKNNCRQRDIGENNSSNTIKIPTLYQQIEILITKIRDLQNAQQIQTITAEKINF